MVNNSDGPGLRNADDFSSHAEAVDRENSLHNDLELYRNKVMFGV